MISSTQVRGYNTQFLLYPQALNDLSYDIKIWTDLSFMLSQIICVWQTDRETTDRILIARPRQHSMQRGNKTDAVGGCESKKRPTISSVFNDSTASTW